MPSLTPSCWARQGGTLGSDLRDCRETASYESVLIAPFIPFIHGSILSFKWLQVRDSAEGPTELSGCVRSQPVRLKRCIDGLTLRLSTLTASHGRAACRVLTLNLSKEQGYSVFFSKKKKNILAPTIFVPVA